MWNGADNLLPNPDFEDGARDWHLWHRTPGRSSGKITYDPAGDTVAYYVRGDDSAANLYSEPVPCVPESGYVIAVRVRVTDGKGIGLCAWGVDAEGGTLDYRIDGETQVPGTVPRYRWFVKRFTTPPECSGIRAHLLCDGGEVWWDRCILVREGESLNQRLASLDLIPAEQPAWARFQLVFRTPVNCVGVKAVLTLDSGTAWVDAVQIEPGRHAGPFETGPNVSGPASQAVNILPNSGFEGGDVGWNLWHQDPTASSGGVREHEGRGGTAAFRVDNPGTGGANLFSDPVICEPVLRPGHLRSWTTVYPQCVCPQCRGKKPGTGRLGSRRRWRGDQARHPGHKAVARRLQRIQTVSDILYSAARVCAVEGPFDMQWRQCLVGPGADRAGQPGVPVCPGTAA